MKTLLLVFLIGAVAGAGLSAPGVGQALSLRTVSDTENRFTLKVPVTWHVRTSSGDPALAADAPAQTGGSPDSVNVIVRDLPASLSPETCVRQAQFVMRYVIHSYTTLHQGPERIADLPAYAHAYTWRTKTGEDRRSLQVCITLGRRAFVLIGTTNNTPDRVREEMPMLARIIETFRPSAQQPESSPPKPGGNNR